MASGVVTIGRQSYAVGLYWENSPGGGRVAQIAKEAASQAGQQADFYAVRPGNKNGRVPQFGLSGVEGGHKAGMPTLAACLAGQMPGSWAGAFRFSEGTAVVVVRDDLIVPDGDLFFLDETEARDRLLQEIGFGGLESTYAPDPGRCRARILSPSAFFSMNARISSFNRYACPSKLRLPPLRWAACSSLFSAASGGGRKKPQKRTLSACKRKKLCARAGTGEAALGVRPAKSSDAAI